MPLLKRDKAYMGEYCTNCGFPFDTHQSILVDTKDGRVYCSAACGKPSEDVEPGDYSVGMECHSGDVEPDDILEGMGSYSD